MGDIDRHFLGLSGKEKEKFNFRETPETGNISDSELRPSRYLELLAAAHGTKRSLTGNGWS